MDIQSTERTLYIQGHTQYFKCIPKQKQRLDSCGPKYSNNIKISDNKGVAGLFIRAQVPVKQLSPSKISLIYLYLTVEITINQPEKYFC